jgi:hypothetical protein
MASLFVGASSLFKIGIKVSRLFFLLVFVVNTVDEVFRIAIDFGNGLDLVEFCCSII